MLLNKESLRRHVHWLYSALCHNNELEGEAEVAAFYSGPDVSAGSEPSRATESQRSAPSLVETSDNQVWFRLYMHRYGTQVEIEWVEEESLLSFAWGRIGGWMNMGKKIWWVDLFICLMRSDEQEKRPVQTSVQFHWIAPSGCEHHFHWSNNNNNPSIIK